MAEPYIAQLQLKANTLIYDSSKDTILNNIVKLDKQTNAIRMLYKDLYEINDHALQKTPLLLENQLKCHSCDWKLTDECTNSNCISFNQPISNYFVNDNVNNKKDVRFRCSLCIKSYKSKENLILHKSNIHMNFKPYKCSKCSKRFSHRNGKLYHESTFHSEEVK